MRRTDQRGFTLLELVIVIILLGILSVGAYVNWPGSVMSLSGQAWEFAEDLSYAQSLSMTADQRYRVVKTASNTYQIQNSAGTAVASSSGATTVTLNGSIVFGTLTNLPNNLVSFDGQGAPYSTTGSPGTALAGTGVWTLTSGGNSQTVSVTPVTGRVTIP